LPYRKDREARKAMLRLSRPQTAKKRNKPEDPAARERDLALLRERCKTDVESTRASYRHPRLRKLLPEERELLLLDGEINFRGIRVNSPFLKAVSELAAQERNAVNTCLDQLTVGAITSVDQVQRIRDAVNAYGHNMTTLNKRSVAATLAHNLNCVVRELLELRQRGAYASVRAAKRLLSYADPKDERIRGALRIYGAGPGRWSSPGAQLHNPPPQRQRVPDDAGRSGACRRSSRACALRQSARGGGRTVARGAVRQAGPRADVRRPGRHRIAHSRMVRR
jgi:DNA polymerase bacteriophage-type